MGFSLARITACLLLVALAHPFTAQGDDLPLRDPSGLANPGEETMVRIPYKISDRNPVILADYDALREDFPEELRHLSDAEIDEKLLHGTHFISYFQSEQEVVNSRIPTSPEKIRAFRPEDYGRSIVFKFGKGLIDAKGSGAGYPGPDRFDHGSGLLSLGEALREFAYERLLRLIFLHSGSGFKTVKTYAVIDLGFDIKDEHGNLVRAGMVLRRAHTRSPGIFALLSNALGLKIEKLLRRYGVTSAGAHRNRYPHEWLNVQGTKEGAVVDMGGYLTVDKFEKPLGESFDETGRTLLMSADEVRSLQPDPALRVPLNEWGTTLSGKADPAFDNPTIRGHQLAERIRSGQANREDARRFVKDLLDPVIARLWPHGAGSVECVSGQLQQSLTFR